MTKTPVHTLYRFFDSANRLLYVGRTVDARSRWRTHERSKEWFDAVAKVTREVFPTAESLDAAERAAIQGEAPIHNVALNGSRRPSPKVKVKQSEWLSDDLFVSRLMSLAGDSPSFEAEEPCDDEGYIESGCECFLCHRERMSFLDRVEADSELDQTMLARCQRLREQYAAGAWMSEWLDTLLDLELFRPLELGMYSAISPAPAYAEVVDGLLQVECPFCSKDHQHFLASGSAIGPMSAGCSSQAKYEPVFDYLEWTEDWATWIASEARFAERGAA